MSSSTTTPEMSPEKTPERNIHRFVGFAAAGFLVTCVIFFFMASSISPEVQPGFPLSAAAAPQTDGTFRVTMDVSHRQNWIGVNLAAGKLVHNPDQADVLARRYILRAPGGAVDLGTISLENAAVPEGSEWVRDEGVDGAPQNAALTSWYDYSYLTHLLESKGKTFAVKLADGTGTAYVRVLSYYCEPEGSGCLTLQYRLERG